MRSPVKVAYLMDMYAHPYGGTERQVLELIQNLDRSRFQPHVAVFRESEYLSSNEFNCPVDILGIEKLASVLSIIKLYRYIRELKKREFSIVHIYFNDASIIAPPFLKLTGLRIIVSRRDMGFWYNAVNSKFLQFNRIFVDRVITNSQAVKKSVQDNEGYPDSKVTVIYNGYNRARNLINPGSAVKENLGINSDSPIVGIVANLRPIKRIDDLIKAFAIVVKKYTNAWLVIVGAGEQRDMLHNLAVSLGIIDRVIFTGQIANVVPIIQEFTVGVLCSESEGFSNSILEYMNLGKPTVCTDVGGNPEIVQDGINGFLVSIGDVNGLADRICRLLADPQLQKRQGNNALDLVRKKYDVGTMANAHMDLYEDLI